MRRSFLHVVAAELLVRKDFFVGKEIAKIGLGLRAARSGVADVPSEGYLWRQCENLTESLQLVVHERVHWVEQEGPSTRLVQRAGRAFVEERIEDRHEEGLGFTGTRSGRDDDVSALGRFSYGHVLMAIQDPIGVDAEAQDTIMKDAFCDEIA